MQPNTHAQEVDTVLKSSNVIATSGLTQAEADKRLAEYGPNLLIEKVELTNDGRAELHQSEHRKNSESKR